jgi:hypothetical protein
MGRGLSHHPTRIVLYASQAPPTSSVIPVATKATGRRTARRWPGGFALIPGRVKTSIIPARMK